VFVAPASVGKLINSVYARKVERLDSVNAANEGKSNSRTIKGSAAAAVMGIAMLLKFYITRLCNLRLVKVPSRRQKKCLLFDKEQSKHHTLLRCDTAFIISTQIKG
jgi:hypothetical protein